MEATKYFSKVITPVVPLFDLEKEIVSVTTEDGEIVEMSQNLFYKLFGEKQVNIKIVPFDTKEVYKHFEEGLFNTDRFKEGVKEIKKEGLNREDFKERLNHNLTKFGLPEYLREIFIKKISDKIYEEIEKDEDEDKSTNY